HLLALFATDKFQTLPGWATECARRSPPVRRAAHPSPFSAAARNGNPAPAQSALPAPSSLATPRRQTSGSLADTSASLPDGRLAACARYGRAAKALRSRSLRSSPSPLRASAKLAAACNLAGPAARANDPSRLPFRDPRSPIHAPPKFRQSPPALAPA